MAKIPAGLTERETPLEEILSTLVDKLGDSEKSEVLKYQEDLKVARAHVTRLQRDKEAKESAAESFGLSSDVLEPMMKEYEKAIEASSENFRKVSEDISKNLGSVLGSDTAMEKLSDDQIENLKALVEISNSADELKKTSSTPKKRESDLSKTVKSSADRLTTALLDSSLGMFGVVTRPIEDLLGFRVTDMIKGGFSKIFGKKEKTEDTGQYLQKRVRPDANSLKGNGIIGAAAVFIGNTLSNLLGKKKDSSGTADGLIGTSLAGGAAKGAAKGATSTLAKAGGIAALAGGIIWGAVDSISAVLKSEKWGVSKVSAAIAGFLSGSGEGGLKDAFKGMGKWALIGAGVGSIVPVIGTITGGLVGAAIGGILGWIGGEKTAKFFDKIGDYFKGAWDSVKNFFVVTIPNFVLSIGSWLGEKFAALKEFFFVKVPEVTKKIWQAAKEVFSNIWGFFVDTFVSIKNTVSEFLFVTIPDKVNTAWTAIKTGLLTVFSFLINGVMFIGQEIKEFFTETIPALALSAWEGIKTGVNYIVDKVVAFGVSIKNAFVEVYTSVSNAVVGFYHDVIDFFTVTLPTWAKEKYNLIVTELKEFFTPAYNAITGFFGNVKEFFVVTIPTWATEKYNEVVTFATGIFDFAKEGVIGFFTSAKNFFMTDIPTFATAAFTEVKETVSGFFDIPKNAIIGFFDDIGVDITSPTLIKDAITSISESFKMVFDKIKNTITDFLSKINPINWISEKIDQIKDPNEKSWWQFWKPDVKDVNDALIFKDGNVYRPAPDDHIIATKTAPTLFNQNGQVVNTGFNSDSEYTRNSSREIQSVQNPVRQDFNSRAFDSMVNLLSSILDVLKDKEMAPSYTDISVPRSLDFEMLR